MFFGYSSTQKGYKCYSLELKKIIVSRDVRFDETQPFFNKLSTDELQGESCFELFPLPRAEESSLETPPLNVSSSSDENQGDHHTSGPHMHHEGTLHEETDISTEETQQVQGRRNQCEQGSLLLDFKIMLLILLDIQWRVSCPISSYQSHMQLT